MVSRLLTTEQVADLLCVERHTVYRLRRSGELPVVELGPGLLRYDPADVQAFVERRKRQPVPTGASR